MSDFLLEIRCEEIPARMQAGARRELERLFRREMDAEDITFDDLTIWSSPRRLTLIARGLPEQTEPSKTETKGPRVGAPDQAIDGFLRRYERTRDDLIERDGIYFLEDFAAGRSMMRVIQDVIPKIIESFSWPKSMRWGEASLSTESLRWVRPLSGIVALLGEDLVECEVHGVTSGWVTLGHRFHCPGDITIGSADDYAEKLRACHVIVDHEERAAIIRDGAAKVAADAGLTLVEDEGLVVENAGLTEWPVPLLGRFDEDYLDVPPEVIQLTARVNQKYFVCEDAAGKLANAFICTANIAAEDPAVVVDGNRKVLAARLSDARFFWDVDRKTTLAKHAEKLERITFHEKLGSVAERAQRIGKIFNVITGGHDDEKREAKSIALAMMAKGDLVTEMVGEFPELQGLMGSYYAHAEGQPDNIASAIRDHYLPTGAADGIPENSLGHALAISDKVEALSSFFAIGLRPTGSKDPYALRRAALGLIRIILETKQRIDLRLLVGFAILELCTQKYDKVIAYIDENYGQVPDYNTELDFDAERGLLTYKGFEANIAPDLLLDMQLALLVQDGNEVERFQDEVFDFIVDRLKVQQREAGVRHDLIEAIFVLGGEHDLVRLLARVHALQAFIETDNGANLLAGYKRAANILKKEDWRGIEGEIAHTGEEDPLSQVDDPEMAEVIAAKMEERHAAEHSYTLEPAEKALTDALDAAEPQAEAAIAKEDFAAAMAALASLRAPIDAFFEEVTVNDENADKRAARLDLLARFRAAVHNVADFSKIEG
ncbi:glycine--tRNA ligase subunit beta [Erythrobacter alti]|uniref:glycine--tRNA ligase subunit beta n=1 Tax=Erythrobacter alti TaxID=1896145 RepID=UPI0030F482ED